MRNRRGVSDIKPKYVFDSEFEEKKSLQYISNLINSRFIDIYPVDLFKFAMEALGTSGIAEILQEQINDTAEDREPNKIQDFDDLVDNVPVGLLVELLVDKLSPIINKKLKQLSTGNDSEIEKRLKTIKKTFSLLPIDIEIIAFRYYLETSRLIEKYLYDRSSLDFMPLSGFRSHGHILFGVAKKDFLEVFTKGTLFSAFIIQLDSANGYDLSQWCIEYLTGIGNADIAHEFFSVDNEESLAVSDFDIDAEELMVIDDLLKSTNRHNLLFYGVPGTGKTSLAKSLAKKYGKAIYSVKTSITDEHKDRLRAIYATITIADSNDSIILIDEADEILNSSGAFYYKNVTNKSWINNILDTHDKKVIWITNRVSEIEQSTMRRFSFSLEFKKFSRQKRLNVLQYGLKARGLEGYFNSGELDDLCSNYSVNADGIINAVSIFNIEKKDDKTEVLKKIKSVLKNHEKATTGKTNRSTNKKSFGSYSLEGLNTSHNLENIISTINQFVQLSEKDAIKHARSVSLLLYGIPGTGKTEFVHYLGSTLDKEVVLKRCSDIQSMWVGQSEQNISNAFEEARTEGNILFFDEADSFLFPRKNANHSREKSFTNEILAQLDSYAGIVIFATNDICGLDHAALRRFKFKVEFNSLTPEGNIYFYNSLLKPLVAKEKGLSEEYVKMIANMGNLTPGDFAVVKDQFLFIEPSAVSHRQLVESLQNELKHKNYGQRQIGFGN